MNAVTYDSTSSNSNAVGWITAARMFVGFWWIIEATIGRFWKFGSFASGLNPEWFGPEAGSRIAGIAQTGIDEGAWWWYVSVLENVLLPSAGFWAPVVSYLQLLIGIALVLGFFTRFTASGGLLMLVSIILMGSFRTSPFLIAGHLFILATNAGLYYSIDRRLFGARPKSGFFALLATAPLNFSKQIRGIVGIAAGVLGLYFLMQTSSLPFPRYIYVSQELAVFLGMIAVGLYMSMHTKHSTLTIATAMLRVYLGYKLLWWMWTAPNVSLTSLPGLDDPTRLAETFAQGAESHWLPLAALIQGAFLPLAGFWSAAFGAAQLVIGILLVIGWRTRAANWAAIWLTLLYTLLGFTRYAPYILGFSFIVMALGSGVQLSFVNSMLGRPAPKAQILALPVPSTAIYGLLSLVGFVLAFLLGVVPNGYSSAVGSTVFWTMGINVGILGLVGLLLANQPASSASGEFADLDGDLGDFSSQGT
ncbi:MAG: DoxX family protein [Chloroflexota bacterium]